MCILFGQNTKLLLNPGLRIIRTELQAVNFTGGVCISKCEDQA